MLVICHPWAAEGLGWRTEAILTSSHILQKLSYFLPNSQHPVPASLSGEGSSVGSGSAVLLGAVSTGTQAHRANWLHTVVSTLQCPVGSAFFRLTSHVQLPMPLCTTTKVLEVVCLLIYLHHGLFMSASNNFKWVLHIAFTLQTCCMLLVATAADTTCDTTARTQDSFPSAWQCHQQLLESCKERGGCGVEYVSIGQG